jgi:hypothetical protein
MKKILIAVAISAITGLTLVGAVSLVRPLFAAHPKSISVHAPAAIPPGNKAPSEEFLIDYANYKTLQKEVRDLQMDSKLIEKQRLLQGTVDALNAQVPPGFLWDEDTNSFKPRPPAPAPPVPLKP